MTDPRRQPTTIGRLPGEDAPRDILTLRRLITFIKLTAFHLAKIVGNSSAEVTHSTFSGVVGTNPQRRKAEPPAGARSR